jgi:hypothetical protein
MAEWTISTPFLKIAALGLAMLLFEGRLAPLHLCNQITENNSDIVEVLDGKTADWMKKLPTNTIKPDHD